MSNKYYVYISHNADKSLYYIGVTKCPKHTEPKDHEYYGPETRKFKPVGKKVMGIYDNKLDAEDHKLELMFMYAAYTNPSFINKYSPN